MLNHGYIDCAEFESRWLDDGHALTIEHVGAEFERECIPLLRFPEWHETRGLVDLQVNGFAGVDFNDTAITAEALDHALEAMLATGVTVCLPTLITAQPEVMMARLEALDAAVSASQLGHYLVPGYHIEGPFLNGSAGYAGCHPTKAMDNTDKLFLRRLQACSTRPILLTTIAPEHPMGPTLIREARASGIIVAVGHSRADHRQIKEAVEAGVTMSTHLGNGLPQMLPKLDNTLFAQLAEDRLAASFIADGIHIPPFALHAMLNAKGMTRSILITDAVSAAASPPGIYRFAGMEIELSIDGKVNQPGESHLAGSALCLDQAVRNLIQWEICPPLMALRLACHNPMSMLSSALREFNVHLPSSRVIWDDQIEVVEAAVGPWRWRR